MGHPNMTDPTVSLEPSKWQELYVGQLSYSINLVLGMATAAIGFCISQMTKSDVDHQFNSLIKLPVFLLAISVLCGVLCTLVRLDIFRRRRKNPDFERHFLVAPLVFFQLITFLFGVLWVGLGIFFIS